MYPQIGISPYVLGSYTLCAMLGLVAIVLLSMRQLKMLPGNNGLETKILACVPMASLCGLLFAYASDALFHMGMKIFSKPLHGFGITFYGWLFGCILFYVLYAPIVHLKFVFLMNFFLPSFSIAQAIGRIGCFLGGCCFGRPGECFAVRYPEGSLPYETYGNEALFPVQVFESIYLALMAVLLFKGIRFEYRGAAYLLLLAPGRFLLEFLRGDSRGGSLLPFLSPAQTISIVAFIFGAVFLAVQYRKEHSLKDR